MNATLSAFVRWPAAFFLLLVLVVTIPLAWLFHAAEWPFLATADWAKREFDRLIKGANSDV